MRGIYFAIDAIIATGLLSLSAVSLLKGGYKNVINRLFAAFSVFVALWIVSNQISNDVGLSKEIATIADYIVFSASFGAVIIFMKFVAKLSSARKMEKLVNRIQFPLWVVCVICATPLVVAGVEAQSDVYAVIFGPLIWLYAVGLFIMIGFIIYGMSHGLRKLRGAKRRQLMSISIGLGISLPLVLVFSFIIPLFTGIFSVTEFGIAPLLILVISLYYGVVRYKLFDIRLAAVRTVAYVLSLSTLSAVYYFAAYFISVILFNGDPKSSIGTNPINIVLALLLAFIFQPVKKFFNKITDKFFYKDNYNTDDFFAMLNKVLNSTIDLRDLLELVSIEISNTLKSEQAFFFIYTNDGHYVSAGTPGHRQLPKVDADRIVKVSNNKTGVLDIYMLEEGSDIRRLMTSHRIELVLPLFQEGRAIGFFFLGETKASRYTTRDIKVLNAVSNELVIAIRNALAVQEIREFNVTLKQKVANATEELRSSNRALKRLDKAKDEFVSVASHQLRTPLTSVKGYISMVMEGDAGKVSAAQKQLLGEAFNSSERMVSLINDFLNVSRIQTGKFMIDKHPVDLAKLVDQEVNSLRANAATRGIKLAYDMPKNAPLFNLDEGKIRQVVMNFIDNAIYYSHEDTTIVVKFSIGDTEAKLTIKDNGIGVPKDEQAELFTKFYRASNAKKQRPDGTGVGLYLAKKIILDHDGKLIFESAQDKGSTFGFSLPIKPILVASSDANDLNNH